MIALIPLLCSTLRIGQRRALSGADAADDQEPDGPAAQRIHRQPGRHRPAHRKGRGGMVTGGTTGAGLRPASEPPWVRLHREGFELPARRSSSAVARRWWWRCGCGCGGLWLSVAAWLWRRRCGGRGWVVVAVVGGPLLVVVLVVVVGCRRCRGGRR